jgi:hypothetical protein
MDQNQFHEIWSKGLDKVTHADLNRMIDYVRSTTIRIDEWNQIKFFLISEKNSRMAIRASWIGIGAACAAVLVSGIQLVLAIWFRTRC